MTLNNLSDKIRSTIILKMIFPSNEVYYMLVYMYACPEWSMQLAGTNDSRSWMEIMTNSEVE